MLKPPNEMKNVQGNYFKVKENPDSDESASDVKK